MQGNSAEALRVAVERAECDMVKGLFCFLLFSCSFMSFKIVYIAIFLFNLKYV